MSIYQEKLIESINMIIEEKISELQFNYEITGKIIEESVTGNFNIDYNGQVTTARAISADIYEPGDLVHILVLNNDFSNKIILCKKP